MRLTAVLSTKICYIKLYSVVASNIFESRYNHICISCDMVSVVNTCSYMTNG